MAGFKYNAIARGLKVQIHSPTPVELPVVAPADLRPEGGMHTAREDLFRFDSVVSARSVQSVVSGAENEGGDGIDELASVVVEDLNVLGVLTADRVVARLSAVHRKGGGPPEITPLGSHFDNLRIAGKRFEFELAIDTFTRLNTAEKVHAAYNGGESGFREEFEKLSLIGKLEAMPERLRRYFPLAHRESGKALQADDEAFRVGLARGIGDLPPDFQHHGHVIHVPGFGVIRLAELVIERTARELKMVHIDLGSTPKGCVTAGHVRGNGSGW